MATPSSLLSEEQFLCSICLEVFVEPVAIPCGHNFCLACIRKYWDSSDPCLCPMCKKLFPCRPELFINTFISEMATQFKMSLQVKDTGSGRRPARCGEVPCDICTEVKLKATKSCLVCLTSYCDTHLESHQRVAALKKHQLIDPVANLEDRMCEKHGKILELFCRSDERCICVLCLKTDHETHKTVLIEDEYGEKMSKLGRRMAEVQKTIHWLSLKVKDIKCSVDLGVRNADKEIAESVKFFSTLVLFIERSRADLVKVIEEKQKAAQKRAEGFVKELEKEIAELQRTSADLERLSHTDDHLQLLQSFPSLSTTPSTKDWSEISVHSDLCVGTVRGAVSQLKETLSGMIATEMRRLGNAELKTLRKWSVDVILDPDTAHCNLSLSDDGKRVEVDGTRRDLPDNPKRFDPCIGVIAKRGIASGRFYYEVRVTRKTDWSVGLARESVNRKGKKTTLTPESGYWAMRLLNHKYEALSQHRVALTLKTSLQKLGVFVDYEEGRVTFYDVEAACHIYSFKGCTFTEKLYPYLCPHVNKRSRNSDPLILRRVSSLIN